MSTHKMDATSAAVGRVQATPTLGGFAGAVIVPFCQAAISGLGAGAVVGLLFRLWYSKADAITAGAIFGALAFVVAWVGLLLDIRSQRVAVYPVAESDQASRRVVLLNPKEAAQPGDDHAGRFADFVQACELDTSTRRLMALGFTRDEIEGWRLDLMRSGWANWSGSDRRRGWRLTAEAAVILEALG